jgi:hypothetical protein
MIVASGATVVSRKLYLIATFTGVVALMPLTSHADKHALVVGVNACPNYLDKNNNAFRALRGAEVGAAEFRDVLVSDYGFPEADARLLTGATYAAIRKEFAKYKRLTADDQFVFYFAGHGTQVDEAPTFPPPFDEKDRIDEALCPADAVRREKNHNLIVDDELDSWLREIDAGRITLVFDCCFAGTVDKGPDDSLQLALPPIVAGQARGNRLPAKDESPWEELTIVAKGPRKRIIALYACAASQEARERKFPGLRPNPIRCQFTKFLLDGLKGRRAVADNDPRDGRISVGEITRFTTTEIAQWANQRVTQEPSFIPREDRDWALFE